MEKNYEREDNGEIEASFIVGKLGQIPHCTHETEADCNKLSVLQHCVPSKNRNRIYLGRRGRRGCSCGRKGR